MLVGILDLGIFALAATTKQAIARQGTRLCTCDQLTTRLLHHSHHFAREKAHFFGPSLALGQTKLPQRAPPPRASNKRCRAPTATTTCRSRRCRRRVPPGRRATATATQPWPTRPRSRRRPRPAIPTATRPTTTCPCPSSNHRKRPLLPKRSDAGRLPKSGRRGRRPRRHRRRRRRRGHRR